MELVTEPDMHSAKEAVSFAKELQLILRYLGISEADLDRGQMRADANVSISADDSLGTKAEVKNLNSFRSIEDAINFEIQRQSDLLDAGEKVKQETRGWDDIKRKTVSQRSKEEAHDYRYFPEPDIPPMDQSAFDMTALKLEIPELPNAKRKRFVEQLQITTEQANILAEDRTESEYFEEAISEWEADQQKPLDSAKIALLFNYLNTDLKGLMGENNESNFSNLKITPEDFADLMDMTSKNEISSRTAKDLLVRMFESGADPKELVKAEGLGQVPHPDRRLGRAHGLGSPENKKRPKTPEGPDRFRWGLREACP